MSPGLASVKETPFYETVRSLTLLEQAQRFEAVLSAGMTVSWFALLSLYLCLCGKKSETLFPGRAKWGIGVSTTIAVIGVLCDMTIPLVYVSVLAAIFWVLVPVLTPWIDRIKNSKKSENSA